MLGCKLIINLATWVAENFSSLIQTISIIIASGVGLYGINSWKRELTGKRQIEITEEVLALFYECRDHIEYIRSPFSTVEEGKTRKRNTNETREESEVLDNAYVVFERYQKVSESFSRLLSLKYKFMVIFGAEHAQYFNDLKKIVNDIFRAAKQLGRYYWKERTGLKSAEEQKRFADKMEELENIFYSVGDENDPISSRVDEVIRKVEQACQIIVNK